MDDELRDKFRAIYTAIQHGDGQELAANLAHDIEWVLPDSVPWGGIHRGQLGVVAMRESYAEHVDGLWADPDDLLVDGDRVVVLGRMSGRGRASGDSFEVRFAHVWALNDGVPFRFHSYHDTVPILKALGSMD